MLVIFQNIPRLQRAGHQQFGTEHTVTSTFKIILEDLRSFFFKT